GGDQRTAQLRRLDAPPSFWRAKRSSESIDAYDMGRAPPRQAASRRQSRWMVFLFVIAVLAIVVALALFCVITFNQLTPAAS
ncbi:MAG: hypothetical protein HC937_02955, partial [Aquincola sp.]|nr:hypothetical protein [Aquincola sp.]